MKPIFYSTAAVALIGALLLVGLPTTAQPTTRAAGQETALAPEPYGFFDAVFAREDQFGPQRPVSFVAREPFVGKRRIRLLITRPRAAAQELTESIISNSSGLTTKDVKRIRRALEQNIRRNRGQLRVWLRDPHINGVFAHLIYTDSTVKPTASVTFSPIR